MWLAAYARLTMLYVKGVRVNLHTSYSLGAVTIAGTAMIVLVTDAVMIYRCWIVYRKSWRITAFPVLCWLGCLISFILVFYYNHQLFVASTATKAAWAVNQSRKGHIFLYPCNAATNIYTTAAIIFRVMHHSNKGSGHSLKRLQKLCRILAETGILYTLTTIPPFVVFFLDPQYAAVLQATEALNFSMAGIAFNLVLIRVGQSRVGADGGRLGPQISDRQRLLLGQHHRHLSSSTQGQCVTVGDAENGVLSQRSAVGAY